MKKRVLSLFMALALCFSMLPTAALAEEAGAAPDAANADSTYTTGEDAGLAGGEDFVGFRLLAILRRHMSRDLHIGEISGQFL